jgi:hypothetical protein
MLPSLLIAAAVFLVVGLLLFWTLRRKHLHRLVLPYLLQSGKRRRPRPGEPVHLLLCVADHFEPLADGASADRAMGRVEKWVREYPRQFGAFRDSDGRPPRHTFFYPIEEYDPAYLDALAGLCRAGFGEVELHLHHDNDTAKRLRERLLTFKELFAERHGLLARHRQTGELAYGFIHGNWALCNARPDGRCCGVNNELAILGETGCYADFTMPSAPDVSQTAKVNSIYYAWDRPGRPRSHETGIDAGTAAPPAGSLLLIQGPLVLRWDGLRPRLENGCLQASQPPDIARLDAWLRARVQVSGRPDWFFVKLHAHGAEEVSHDTLLGEPMARFHEGLARLAREQPNFHFHYVTAREMYNLVKAAEAGWQGSVADALDYELLWNGGHGPRPEVSAAPDLSTPATGLPAWQGGR